MSKIDQNELIYGLNNIKSRHRGCVLTMGSFDGVHLGHQRVLAQVIDKAREHNVPSAVMIFEPQPLEFLAPSKAPARLMRFREKVQALFATGIDRVFCLRFNQRVSAFTAKSFTEQVLVGQLDVKHLVVGDDFRFGYGRSGDFPTLKKYGEELGFTVSDTQTHAEKGERISSTRIRQALLQGDFSLAEKLLGKPYVIAGHVVYGNQLGRQLGLPTANVELHRFRSPLTGVFTVKASLPGHGVLYGVANVGRKPTIKGRNRVMLEVHLLDFAENIYGQMLTVQFCHKLREEQKFDSLDQLKAQIERDVDSGRDYFSVHA